MAPRYLHKPLTSKQNTREKYEVQQQGNNTQNTKSQKGNIHCQGILIFCTNIVEWITKAHQRPYITGSIQEQT